MEVLAFTWFLFFLGSLSSAMRLAEGGGGALSTTAFGAGLMSITIKLGSAAPLLAAHTKSDELGRGVTAALQDMNNASLRPHLLPARCHAGRVCLGGNSYGRPAQLARFGGGGPIRELRRWRIGG